MILDANQSPEELARNMSPELVRIFEESVAIKMWPNGDPMSEAQVETVVAALLLRQALLAPSEDPFSIDEKGDLVLGKGRRVSNDNRQAERTELDAPFSLQVKSDWPRQTESQKD